MLSSLSNYWVSIGLVASLIVTCLTWIYFRDLAPIFMFIAGAFFTMLAQERLEKKRQKRSFAIEMTKHVYGLLHKELSSILVNLRGFQSSTGASLDNIVKDFRFGFVKEELGRQIKEFRERLTPYPNLSAQARHETDFHVSMVLGKHKIKRGVIFSGWLGHEEIFRIPIINPIFEDKTPLDYLTERMRHYKNASTLVYVNEKSEGRFSSEHRIHQISKDILRKVREDPSVQKQRKEREYLIKEGNSIIESIEKEIVL